MYDLKDDHEIVDKSEITVLLIVVTVRVNITTKLTDFFFRSKTMSLS